MMKISRVFILIFSAGLLLGLPFSAAAQTKAPEPRQLTAIRSDGWQIPKTGLFNINGEVEKDIGGQKILTRSFSRKKDVDIKLDHYHLKEDGSLIVFTRSYVVFRMTALAVGGNKVFGYWVLYQRYEEGPLVKVDKNTTIKFSRSYAGAVISFFYFDEDGDGKFETRYSALKMPELPQWVKNTK